MHHKKIPLLFCTAIIAVTIIYFGKSFQATTGDISDQANSTDWEELVRNEIERAEYDFIIRGLDSYSATNRRQGSRFKVDASGFVAEKRMNTSDDIHFSLIDARKNNVHTPLQLQQFKLENPALLQAIYSDFFIEYVNTTEGFRQNFIFPKAGPNSVSIALKIAGADEMQVVDDNLLCKINEQTVLQYGDLLAYDAHGKKLPAQMQLEGDILTLTAQTDAAVFPVTIDPLTTSPSWSFEANQAGANVGFAVSGAGDVNNDGYDDVLVGAAAFDAGQVDEGKAFLFLGGPSGLSLTPVWEDEGDNTGGLMGKSVTAAGDVNGDGYDDILIGLGLYSGGQSEEGRAQLYYGTASGVTTEPVWGFEPDQAGVGLGFPVSGLGDVNGDGFDDVVIGGNGWDGDLVDEGKAFVFYGSPTGLGSVPDWSVEGNVANAALGHAVGAAGDVNHDGYDDLILGGWNYSGALVNSGKALVFLGGPLGLETDPVWEMEGDQENGYYAFWVSGVGDVNNDSYDDIMVGAKRYDVTYEDEGKAWLFLGGPGGPSTTASWTGQGDNNGAEYAIQFGPAGDVNGDSFDDVIIGSHFHTDSYTKEGKSYLYLGGPAGLNLSSDWSALGGNSQANFGWSCDGAGDVNNDGYADVIIGAFKFSNPESSEGAAFLFQGVDNCVTPSGYVLNDLNPTNAEVSWTGSVAATFHKISVKSAGEMLLFLSLTDSFNITGLTPSKKYKSWVQTKCGSTWTNRSNVLVFITPPMRLSEPNNGHAWPNPAMNWLHISPNQSDAGNAFIEVFDVASGQSVMAVDAGFIDEKTIINLDISMLSPGIYIYRVQRNGQLQEGRFVKQ